MEFLDPVTAEFFKKAEESARSGLCVTRDLDDEIQDLKPVKPDVVRLLQGEGRLDVKSNDVQADRVIPWTMSTEKRDRHGDRIKVAGWKLRNYHKNPVVLSNHMSWAPPIGRAIKTWKEEDQQHGARLRTLIEFMPKDLNEFADTVFRMVTGGWVKTGSVGFMAIDAGPDPEADEETKKRFWSPFLFKSQELLEQSIVTIPANPQAVVGAKGAGIDLSPLKLHLTKILDGEIKLPKVYTREQLEAVFKEVTGNPVVVPVPEPPFEQVNLSVAPNPPKQEPAKEPADVLERITPDMISKAVAAALTAVFKE